MSTVKIEAHVDVTNPVQVEALNTFLKTLGGEKQPCETTKNVFPPFFLLAFLSIS